MNMQTDSDRTYTESAKSTLRFIRIALTSSPLIFSFMRDKHYWLLWGRPVKREDVFHKRRAKSLVKHIASLGPAFIKVAQVFASRRDLVAEPYITELSSLTDSVPAVHWKHIERALLSEYDGTDLNSIFRFIDQTPLAAGSLGQVHKASLCNGKNVVIKVLRPGVEPVVRRDVRISLFIASKIAEKYPSQHTEGIYSHLKEFGLRVEEEMDFYREARQCERIKEQFKEDPRVRIPFVENSLTRKRVLVLEYLEGKRIDNLTNEIENGELTAKSISATLIELYAKMMLRDGLFHADPHAGNLLVSKEGQLILLDFGMVIEVPEHTRQSLFKTIMAAVNKSAPDTAAGFKELGMIVPGTPDSVVEDLVKVLLDIAYADTTTTEKAQVLVERVMRELFDWPVVLPGELVYFARTAALIEGVGTRYDPYFNSIKVASPIVLKLRREILKTLFNGQDNEEKIVSIARGLGTVTGFVMKWLKTKVAEGVIRTPTP